MADSSGETQKFKTPPDILTVESKLKSLKLTNDQLNDLLLEMIENNITTANNEQERKAWIDMKVKKTSKTMVKRLEEAFIEDFNLWLHGRSPHNVVEKLETKWEDDPYHGYVRRQTLVKYTPWGNKPLTFLPEVRKYLEGPILNRDHVIKVLTKLKLTGPRTIEEAWIYYKYIVRKVGIDGNIINEQNAFSDFDLLNRDILKMRELAPGVFVPDVDYNYVPGVTDNPAPPLFSQPIYTVALREVRRLALNGVEEYMQTPQFKMLGPEDKLFSMTLFRRKKGRRVPLKTLDGAILWEEFLPPEPEPEEREAAERRAHRLGVLHEINRIGAEVHEIRRQNANNVAGQIHAVNNLSNQMNGLRDVLFDNIGRQIYEFRGEVGGLRGDVAGLRVDVTHGLGDIENAIDALNLSLGEDGEAHVTVRNLPDALAAAAGFGGGPPPPYPGGAPGGGPPPPYPGPPPPPYPGPPPPPGGAPPPPPPHPRGGPPRGGAPRGGGAPPVAAPPPPVAAAPPPPPVAVVPPPPVVAPPPPPLAEPPPVVDDAAARELERKEFEKREEERRKKNEEKAEELRRIHEEELRKAEEEIKKAEEELKRNQEELKRIEEEIKKGEIEENEKKARELEEELRKQAEERKKKDIEREEMLRKYEENKKEQDRKNEEERKQRIKELEEKNNQIPVRNVMQKLPVVPGGLGNSDPFYPLPQFKNPYTPEKKQEEEEPEEGKVRLRELKRITPKHPELPEISDPIPDMFSPGSGRIKQLELLSPEPSSETKSESVDIEEIDPSSSQDESTTQEISQTQEVSEEPEAKKPGFFRSLGSRIFGEKEQNIVLGSGKDTFVLPTGGDGDSKADATKYDSKYFSLKQFLKETVQSKAKKGNWFKDSGADTYAKWIINNSVEEATNDMIEETHKKIKENNLYDKEELTNEEMEKIMEGINPEKGNPLDITKKLTERLNESLVDTIQFMATPLGRNMIKLYELAGSRAQNPTYNFLTALQDMRHLVYDKDKSETGKRFEKNARYRIRENMINLAVFFNKAMHSTNGIRNFNKLPQEERLALSKLNSVANTMAYLSLSDPRGISEQEKQDRKFKNTPHDDALSSIAKHLFSFLAHSDDAQRPDYTTKVSNSVEALEKYAKQKFPKSQEGRKIQDFAHKIMTAHIQNATKENFFKELNLMTGPKHQNSKLLNTIYKGALQNSNEMEFISSIYKGIIKEGKLTDSAKHKLSGYIENMKGELQADILKRYNFKERADELDKKLEVIKKNDPKQLHKPQRVLNIAGRVLGNRLPSIGNMMRGSPGTSKDNTPPSRPSLGGTSNDNTPPARPSLSSSSSIKQVGYTPPSETTPPSSYSGGESLGYPNTGSPVSDPDERKARKQLLERRQLSQGPHPIAYSEDSSPSTSKDVIRLSGANESKEEEEQNPWQMDEDTPDYPPGEEPPKEYMTVKDTIEFIRSVGGDLGGGTIETFNAIKKQAEDLSLQLRSNRTIPRHQVTQIRRALLDVQYLMDDKIRAYSNKFYSTVIDSLAKLNTVTSAYTDASKLIIGLDKSKKNVKSAIKDIIERTSTREGIIQEIGNLQKESTIRYLKGDHKKKEEIEKKVVKLREDLNALMVAKKPIAGLAISNKILDAVRNTKSQYVINIRNLEKSRKTNDQAEIQQLSRKIKRYEEKIESEKIEINTQISEATNEIREINQQVIQLSKDPKTDKKEIEELLQKQETLQTTITDLGEILAEANTDLELEPKITSKDIHMAWLQATETLTNYTMHALQELSVYPDSVNTGYYKAVIEAINSFRAEFQLFDLRKYDIQPQLRKQFTSMDVTLEGLLQNVNEQMVKLREPRGGRRNEKKRRREEPMNKVDRASKIAKLAMNANETAIEKNLPDSAAILTETQQDSAYYAIYYPSRANNVDYIKDMEYLIKNGNEKNLIIALHDLYLDRRNRTTRSITSALYSKGVSSDFMRGLVREKNRSIELLKNRRNPLAVVNSYDENPQLDIFISDEGLVSHVQQELAIRGLGTNTQISEEQYEQIYEETYEKKGENVINKKLGGANQVNLDLAVNNFVKNQILGVYITSSSFGDNAPPKCYHSEKKTRIVTEISGNPLPIFPEIASKFETGRVSFTEDLVGFNQELYVNNAITMMYSIITNKTVEVPGKLLSIINSLKCSSTFYSAAGDPGFKLFDPGYPDKDMNHAVIPSDKILRRYGRMIEKIEETTGNQNLAGFSIDFFGSSAEVSQREIVTTDNKNVITDAGSGGVHNQKMAVGIMRIYDKLFNDLRTVSTLAISQNIRNILMEAKNNDEIGKHLTKVMNMADDYGKLMDMYTDIALNVCYPFRKATLQTNFKEIQDMFTPFKKSYKINKRDFGRVITYSTAAMYTSLVGLFVTMMDKITGKIFDIQARAASKKMLESGRSPHFVKKRGSLSSSTVKSQGLHRYLKSDKSSETDSPGSFYSESSTRSGDDSTSKDTPRRKYPSLAQVETPTPSAEAEDDQSLNVPVRADTTQDIPSLMGEEEIPYNIGNKLDTSKEKLPSPPPEVEPTESEEQPYENFEEIEPNIPGPETPEDSDESALNEFLLTMEGLNAPRPEKEPDSPLDVSKLIGEEPLPDLDESDPKLNFSPEKKEESKESIDSQIAIEPIMEDKITSNYTQDTFLKDTTEEIPKKQLGPDDFSSDEILLDLSVVEEEDEESKEKIEEIAKDIENPDADISYLDVEREHIRKISEKYKGNTKAVVVEIVYGVFGTDSDESNVEDTFEDSGTDDSSFQIKPGKNLGKRKREEPKKPPEPAKKATKTPPQVRKRRKTLKDGLDMMLARKKKNAERNKKYAANKKK